MIKDIIESSINRLKAEKDSAINTALTKNQSAVINPKFAQYEADKAESIKGINQEASKKIADITKACEDAKNEFRNEQILAVKASVGAEYDTAIANMEKELKKYDPTADENKE